MTLDTTIFECGPTKAQKECEHEYDGEGVMLKGSDGKETGWTAVCAKCGISVIDALTWIIQEEESKGPEGEK